MRVSLLRHCMAATIILVRFEYLKHAMHVWVCVPLTGWGTATPNGRHATVWFELFRYYPEELYFEADDFIGRTCEQGIALFHRRDVAYLQR